jgi:ectoine hydrolase
MKSEIISRICEQMAAKGLDALVTVSPENFGYVNQFIVPSQSLIRSRHAITVILSDGTRTILVVDMEESTVRARAADVELKIWGEFTDSPMQVLCNLLTDKGLANATIGIELDYLSATDYSTLSACLPAANFVALGPLLARLRQIKTADEIHLLRKLSLISDQAIHDALDQMSVGSTEMDIASALTRGVYTLGAESFKLMIVATGERSVFPNVGPTSRVLRDSDVCRVEIFSILNGYHAGVCRTAVVKKPPAESERIWQHLVDCKYFLMEMIKPGASSRAIYDTYVVHMKKLNLTPISFIGHGIGLHLHEEPYLSTYSDVQLRAGMVLGIEPLVYDTGFGFGMQNKDMFLVTDSGCELLSDYSNTDSLAVIS